MTTTITKRVAAQGASAGSGATYGNYNWIGWGIAWANCWRGLNPATDTTPAEPAVDVTPRVSALASGGKTSRVDIRATLRLDGEDGHLLLDGDMQAAGADRLSLEGDMVAYASAHTRRVLEPVS